MLYFDHNATTPLAPEVAAVFSEASREFFGNASSIHRQGQQARQQLEQARKTICSVVNAKPGDLIFTSGGTEANNLALAGLLRRMPAGFKHVITSVIEHPAVLETLRALETEGVQISYAGVDADGVVDMEHLESLLRHETVLVSVMHANNETGALQPIQAIGQLVKSRRAAGQEIYFHSDGVQAFGKMPVDLPALGVDLYSISGHKLFAPKGIGGLFVRTGVPLTSLLRGGRHERGRRAGTENVPAALALAKAVELSAVEDGGVLECRNRFEATLFQRAGLPALWRNGPLHARLPNTSNIEFAGVAGESLVISLDMEGISTSTGSACSSGSLEPSPVLLAMGRTRQQARSSVRFSFGRYNSLDDVDVLVNAIASSVKRLLQSAEKNRERHAVLQ